MMDRQQAKLLLAGQMVATPGMTSIMSRSSAKEKAFEWLLEKAVDYMLKAEEGTEAEDTIAELRRLVDVRDDHILRVLNENDQLHKTVADLRGELDRWAQAQDSLRSEWLKIIAALAEIVPVIPGESTLKMVERIRQAIAGLTRNANDGPITLCTPGSWFPPEVVEEARAQGYRAGLNDTTNGLLNTYRAALMEIVEGDSGSLAAATGLVQIAKDALQAKP